MKIGIRKPSIKKSIKARTTGKIKRSIKKATVPAYGKKGTGLIKDPKKAVYNKVYNKTTVSVVPKIDFGSKYSTKSKQSISNNASYSFDEESNVYEAMAERELQIYNDSIEIIKKTTDPDVFFNRFHLMIEKMNRIIEIDSESSETLYFHFNGENVPVYEIAQERIKYLKDNQEDIVSDFLENYKRVIATKIESLKTDPAKRNNLDKFSDRIIKYVSDMGYKNTQDIVNYIQLFRRKL